MAATATKVCTICNADCSDKPRVKDEAGHYACKSCHDKQANVVAPAAKSVPTRTPPPVAPPSAFDEDGIDIRSAAMLEARTQAAELAEAESCPKCHGYLQSDQRLCMRCGFDRKRGAKVMTRVEKVKEQKEERRRQPLDITWIVVGFGLLTVGCAASALLTSAMAVPALLLLSVLGFGLYITIIACQFRDGETVYAVCAIASFFVGVTGFVTLFWLFAVNDRGWLKGLWACMILSYITLIVAVLSNPETAQALREFYGMA